MLCRRLWPQTPASILLLTQSRMGTRFAAIARFLEAIGAPSARSVGIGDFAAERAAAQRVYGWDGIPVYEIQDATFVLSVGADFLGGWVSPVLYSRRYGHMRQGRPELRGRLFHAESRFSLTAWNADRWLPVWPGGELGLVLAIGHVLVADELAPAMDEAPADVVAAFSHVDLELAARSSGIPAPEDSRDGHRVSQRLCALGGGRGLDGAREFFGRGDGGECSESAAGQRRPSWRCHASCG